MKRTSKTIWLAVLLACVLTLGPLPQAARAADANTLTIAYAPEDEAMAGVTFRLYRVADVSRERVSATPVAPYDSYNVLNGSADWLAKASTLAGYISQDGLEADASGVTDETGRLTVPGLPDGMYLILGESQTRDGYTYIPTPFLLFLPNTADGHTWEEHVSTYVKFTRYSNSSPDPTVRRHVLKVWEDDGQEHVRPDSVTVDLLRDGAVYDTVTLSAENNWRHDWTGLEAGVRWQVVERETPGYTVSVNESGITFVVTNTRQDETDITDPDIPLDEKPPEDDLTDIDDPDLPLANLPQTGQLWWPVPLLTIAGVLLLILGAARRRRSAWDEE